LTNDTLSAEASTATIAAREEKSRLIARWTGRKLSAAQLREIASVRKKGKAVFDTFTEKLFASQCCVTDDRLWDLLQDEQSESMTDDERYAYRLNLFRDALWMHVADAMSSRQYSDQPPKQRVGMYLDDLEIGAILDDDIASLEAADQEVAA